MTPSRIHGRCPVCGGLNPLTEAVVLAEHWVCSEGTRGVGRCDGTDRAPLPGSVEEWLSYTAAEAQRVLDNADQLRRVAYNNLSSELACVDREVAEASATLRWVSGRRGG